MSEPLTSCIGPHPPIMVPANFYPFTATGDTFKRHFPDLDEAEIISEFISYHQGKGRTSRNWDAEFIGFCHFRQRQARTRQTESRSTDSMGFDLKQGSTTIHVTENTWGRRFLECYLRHIDAGLPPNEAKDAAQREMEGRDG